MDRARQRVRRAALHDAIRSGDLAVTARAAGRLRVRGLRLDDGESIAARRARRALGRALYAARERQQGEPPRIIREPIPLKRSRIRWRRVLAAGAASTWLVAALALWLASGLGIGGQSGSNARTAPAVTIPLADLSRGITIEAPPIVVGPSPAPSATPAPSAAPTAVPGVPGPSVGPIVSAGGKVPLDLPGVIPGHVRMTVVVLDDATSRPLEDVCVIVGTLRCGADQPKTNSRGIWAFDVPVAQNPIIWDFRFDHAGYVSGYQRVVTSTQDVFTVIRLQRG